MKRIKKVPLAISGLALAIAALGNLIAPHSEGAQLLCGLLSAFLIWLFILKCIFDFQQVKEDTKNPVVLSALPTSTMALMLLWVYALPYIGHGAVFLWYLAVAAHFLIMCLFIRRFIVGLKIQNVFPGCFVASVGIVTVSVTSPDMGALQLGQAIFYVGFTLYFFVLPLIVYRLIKLGGPPEPARPTLAIFAAPMCLCIVGYLSVFPQPNRMLLYGMLTVALIKYICVTVKMVSLIRLKFYPTFAAFTFPYVIGATAFKMGNDFLIANGYTFFSFVPVFSEALAVLIVAYVFVRYAIFLLSAKTTP